MLLIIGLLVMSVNAKIVPLERLKVGDIVDINNLSYDSTEILDDIFNGFDATRFIGTENHKDVFSLHRQKDVCMNLESFINYNYAPTIYVDDKKLKLSLNMKNVTTMKHYNMNIDLSDINDNYLFSIVKVCLFNSEKYLNVKLFDEFDYFMVKSGLTPNIIFNKTGILKYRKNKETSYVSSIVTGDCFFQIFWHTKEMCRDHLNDSLPSAANHSFFESHILKSQIFTSSGNVSLENQIKVQRISLTDHLQSIFEVKEDLLNNIYEKTVIRIDFRSLPNLPELPNEEMVFRSVSFNVLKPGDVIKIDKKEMQYYFNFVGISEEYEEPPSMIHEYTHCYENEIETWTPETRYSTDSDHLEHYYKFSVFHQMIKNYNYGVDREYLNNNYKCLKFTVCSGLRRQKSNSPDLKIVNLEKFSGGNKYNFFENENIVMIHGNSNSSSYHVKAVESGVCLFQALIYHASASKYDAENFHAFPVQRGRIMSASGDSNLENRIKILLASDPLNIFESLFTAKINVLNVTLPIVYMLKNKAKINFYFKNLD